MQVQMAALAFSFDATDNGTAVLALLVNEARDGYARSPAEKLDLLPEFIL
jgi:hypothetical protein